MMPPTLGWILLRQLQLRKYFMDRPTGQSVGGNFSITIPSLLGLVFIKLTKTNQHNEVLAHYQSFWTMKTIGMKVVWQTSLVTLNFQYGALKHAEQHDCFWSFECLLQSSGLSSPYWWAHLCSWQLIFKVESKI